MLRRVFAGLTLSIAVAVAWACGAASAAVEPGPGETARTCTAGSIRAVGTSHLAYAAVVRSRALAYRAPQRGPLAMFGRINVNGVSTVFAVRAAVLGPDCRARWYRVQLPLRPNGVTGYVRARSVFLTRVTTRIVVDLSRHRVTLFRRGRPILHATAAVGSPGTPTPTGRFYVNQRLIPTDSSGPFGPGAVGISAFSDVLTGWAQGGPIAIHGTNQPWSIGRSVSNGCIRLRNEAAKRLFRLALAGTPVTIRS